MRQRMKEKEPKEAMGCLAWSEWDPPLSCRTLWFQDIASILPASTHASSEDLLPNSTDLGYAQPLVTKTYSAPKQVCANLHMRADTFPLDSVCMRLLICCDFWMSGRKYLKTRKKAIFPGNLCAMWDDRPSKLDWVNFINIKQTYWWGICLIILYWLTPLKSQKLQLFPR